MTFSRLLLVSIRLSLKPGLFLGGRECALACSGRVASEPLPAQGVSRVPRSENKPSLKRQLWVGDLRGLWVSHSGRKELAIRTGVKDGEDEERVQVVGLTEVCGFCMP
jgi:hypothetical protein